MLHNIYTPLSGGLAQEKALEIIANNLANLNTVGFKEEEVTFKLLEPEPEKNYKELLPTDNFDPDTREDRLFNLRGNEVAYVGVSGVSRNETQGSPIVTHNPLDLLLQGEGYLTLNTEEGERYTRNGSLSLNPDGTLVDRQGQGIMGHKGLIHLSPDPVDINPLGEIYQNGRFVDKLLITDFEDKGQLEKIGLNEYFYSGPDEGRMIVKSPHMEQGSLEASNVNAIKNLTNMIVAHRSYEAYQKAIKNFDGMMEKSFNTLGELR
ncbi:MAG: flagellar hook-basal body protein [Oligoflexales bacterium]|nr:flagellar hook-basal body protein [Oligoflexales bacterium]